MVASESIAVDGTRIRYLEAGDGAPVVLLHGGIIDAAHVSWPPVIDRLVADRHVLGPELLGYGDSDLPDGPYSIQRHAEVITTVLETLGDQ